MQPFVAQRPERVVPDSWNIMQKLHNVPWKIISFMAHPTKGRTMIAATMTHWNRLTQFMSVSMMASRSSVGVCVTLKPKTLRQNSTVCFILEHLCQNIRERPFKASVQQAK